MRSGRDLDSGHLLIEDVLHCDPGPSLALGGRRSGRVPQQRGEEDKSSEDQRKMSLHSRRYPLVECRRLFNNRSSRCLNCRRRRHRCLFGGLEHNRRRRNCLRSHSHGSLFGNSRRRGLSHFDIRHSVFAIRDCLASRAARPDRGRACIHPCGRFYCSACSRFQTSSASAGSPAPVTPEMAKTFLPFSAFLSRLRFSSAPVRSILLATTISSLAARAGE